MYLFLIIFQMLINVQQFCLLFVIIITLKNIDTPIWIHHVKSAYINAIRVQVTRNG